MRGIRHVPCHGLSRPPRFHCPAGIARRIAARRASGRSQPGNDGNVRSRAEGRRSRAAVRESQGKPALSRRQRDSGARQPVRHAAARRAGHGRRRRRLAHSVARYREIAGVPEGARAAEGTQGRMAEHAPGVHEGARHGAEGAHVGAVPGSRVGGRGRRPRALSGADVLAGRRRAAHHVGTHGHARPAQEAAEPRHLPAAGHCPQQGDHALAERNEAARWTSATTRSTRRASASRSPSRWAPIPRRSWAP